MGKVERNRMGKFASLIREINMGYDYLDKEKYHFEFYDGGQGPFEETEMYKREMELIKDDERKLSSILRHTSKPLVMGGSSKIRRRQ